MYLYTHFTQSDVDEFADGYWTALGWSESGGGYDFDDLMPGDLSPEDVERVNADIARFLSRVDKDPVLAEAVGDDLSRAGHDFVLTRNGHGAGFWDGDWGEYGDALTKIAQSFPEQHLYVGDDDDLVYLLE